MTGAVERILPRNYLAGIIACPKVPVVIPPFTTSQFSVCRTDMSEGNRKPSIKNAQWNDKYRIGIG